MANDRADLKRKREPGECPDTPRKKRQRTGRGKENTFPGCPDLKLKGGLRYNSAYPEAGEPRRQARAKVLSQSNYANEECEHTPAEMAQCIRAVREWAAANPEPNLPQELQPEQARMEWDELSSGSVSFECEETLSP